MQDFTISRLAAEDYARCADIWNMQAQAAMAARFLDQMTAGNRVIFVCAHGDRLVGEGALVYDMGDPDYTIAGRRVYLSRLIVARDWRRRGIGSAIVDHLLAFGASQGFCEFSIGVDVANIAARDLYEKKGFTEVVFQGRDDGGDYVKLLKRAAPARDRPKDLDIAGGS